MSSQAINGHLDPRELADYFAGLLPEDREDSIEAHFAECQDCTSQARQFHTFTQVWDGWTAQAHGEAYWRTVLTNALRATAQTHPRWRERLRHWHTRWAGKAEAAVRVLMEASGETSGVVTEGLEALVRSGGRWQFARAPTPAPTRGVQIRRQTTPAPVALAPGKSQAWVAVSGEDEVSVRVNDWPVGQPSPLVLLIPVAGNGAPQVKELEKVRDAAYLIARFKDVQPGEYVVAFEPVEDTSQ